MYEYMDIPENKTPFEKLYLFIYTIYIESQNQTQEKETRKFRNIWNQFSINLKTHTQDDG